MRMVFVLGRNPFMVSDGTGIAHDTDDILAEVKAHDDLLRVDAVHKDGGEGNSAIVHDVWRVLPSKYSALFYAKVQVRVPCLRHICAQLFCAHGRAISSLPRAGYFLCQMCLPGRRLHLSGSFLQVCIVR